MTALNSAIRATRIQFFLLGLLSGVWGAHIPSVKQYYGLNEGWLSLVLLSVASGAVLSLLFAGRAVRQVGPARLAWYSSVLFATLFALLLWWPSVHALWVPAILIGASMSMLDVAINTEGSALELSSGRKLMSGLHGFFSLGAMAGAGMSAALILIDVSARWQLVGFATAVLIVSKWSAPYLTVAQGHQSNPHSTPDETPHFVWPHGLLLVLALLLFAGMGAEGVMYDWSVLYLKQELGLPQNVAALGYAVFAAAMAAARFGGDWVRARYNEALILQVGAALTAVSMALVLWSAIPGVAFVGFALVGVGIAQVAPILYNAASRVPGQSPAAAIAAVTSIGYGGFLFWPPVVGSLAQHFSLVAALMVVSVSATVLALGAQWVGPRLPKADQASEA